MSFPFQTEKIFKTIIIAFYIVVLIAVAALILGIVFPSLELPLYASVLFSMLFTVLGVVGGSFLSVIADLNSDVYKKYDSVKNDIADNKINSPEDFSQRVSDFLIQTFNYIFFDIQYCIFKTENSKYYYSNESLHTFFTDDLEEFENYAKNDSSVKFIKTIRIDGAKYYCYGIPIWFGKEFLGFFIVLTKQKLNGFFKRYLSDFEDYYVDDQLKIVLDKKLLIEQKRMYQQIDVYSDKITKNEYNSINEYCTDILEYFLEKLSCFGGFIKLDKLSEPIVLFKTTEKRNKELVKHYSTKPLPLEQKYFECPNFGNPILFQVPIGIVKPYGVIYLFSESNSLFKYYNSIIDGVEDIKLDNDFENLIKITNANTRS